MDLYLNHIHFQPQYMRYDDLVERHLAELLGGSSAAGSSSDSGISSGDVDSSIGVGSGSGGQDGGEVAGK